MSEAAERLLVRLPKRWADTIHDDLQAALAAERRATVERIRAALLHVDWVDDLAGYDVLQVDAILDAEAAR